MHTDNRMLKYTYIHTYLYVHIHTDNRMLKYTYIHTYLYVYMHTDNRMLKDVGNEHQYELKRMGVACTCMRYIHVYAIHVYAIHVYVCMYI